MPISQNVFVNTKYGRQHQSMLSTIKETQMINCLLMKDVHNCFGIIDYFSWYMLQEALNAITDAPPHQWDITHYRYTILSIVYLYRSFRILFLSSPLNCRALSRTSFCCSFSSFLFIFNSALFLASSETVPAKYLNLFLHW